MIKKKASVAFNSMGKGASPMGEEISQQVNNRCEECTELKMGFASV